MSDFKTLTIGGNTYTVNDGAAVKSASYDGNTLSLKNSDGNEVSSVKIQSLLPIAFDFWTKEAIFSDIQSGTFTLKKNMPYFGDASSERDWYDNFKKVLDSFPSGYHTPSGFIKTGLRFNCSTGDLTDSYRYANACGISDPEGINITESGTIKTYEIFGKVVFMNPYEIFQDEHTSMDPGLSFAEFEYNIEIEYDSSTDTFTENTFEGELLRYYGELWTNLVNQ